MREANPAAHVSRLMGERNYLAAQLYLRDADIDASERNELLGRLAGTVVDELSRTRREDRERVAYLRSVLSWVLREVPGLGSLYREQLRAIGGGTDMMSELSRGIQGVRDVLSGRKSVADGFGDATEEVRRTLEEAGERIRDGENPEQVAEFLTAAERGLKDGLDQLAGFFRALNRDGEHDDASSERGGDRPGAAGAGTSTESAGTATGDGGASAAARADRRGDVEDAEVADADDRPADDGPINVERR